MRCFARDLQRGQAEDSKGVGGDFGGQARARSQVRVAVLVQVTVGLQQFASADATVGIPREAGVRIASQHATCDSAGVVENLANHLDGVQRLAPQRGDSRLLLCRVFNVRHQRRDVWRSGCRLLRAKLRSESLPRR